MFHIILALLFLIKVSSNSIFSAPKSANSLISNPAQVKCLVYESWIYLSINLVVFQSSWYYIITLPT